MEKGTVWPRPWWRLFWEGKNEVKKIRDLMEELERKELDFRGGLLQKKKGRSGSHAGWMGGIRFSPEAFSEDRGGEGKGGGQRGWH